MSYLVENHNSQTRVLLVEEDQDFRLLAVDYMQRRAELLLVGVSPGGEDTLRFVQDLEPEVILLDLDRVGLGGPGAIPRLRRALPDVGIIGLSMSSGGAYREAVLAAGVDDLVCKSDLTHDLLAAVERVVRTRRLWHRGAAEGLRREPAGYLAPGRAAEI